MDPVYSVFIILGLVWIGLVLCGIVKAINDMLDLKKSEHALNATIWQIRNERENSNLALVNDLKSLVRVVWQNYIKDEKDPEEDLEKNEETK